MTHDLLVELSEDEVEALKRLAADYWTTPASLIAAFVADLVGDDSSGGSDERLVGAGLAAPQLRASTIWQPALPA